MSTVEAARPPYGEREMGWRPVLPWWAWVLAPAAIFATAALGVQLTPFGTAVALWWPAAGLSVLFAMLQPASRLPAAIGLVLVVTSIANAVSGRPLPLALAFGVANAAEVAVVVALLGVARRRFELASLRAGIRFALATLAGAATAGSAAALALMLVEGVAFWPTLLHVTASHAAAVILIAPLAALPRRIPVSARPVEMAVQAVLLGAVIAIVFHPESMLPLAFAPFPLLAWAALRFPVRVVLPEAAIAALLMLVLMLDGGGPFVQPGLDRTLGAVMFELMLLAFGGFAVVLSAAQYELRALSRQVEANHRLLSGSLLDAQIGLVLAAREERATRVTWMNPAGRRLLSRELIGHEWAGPLRSAALAALRSGEQVTVTTDDDRTITVAANRIAGQGDRLAVQLLDVTAMLRARRAQLEAEVERDAARAIRAELERQRDDFLVTTSHELRTPITSIVGYAELLGGGSLGEPERRWVEVIDRNAFRLSELVEDLLTLSRTAPAPSSPQPERLRCDVLLEEVRDNLHVVSAAKQLEVVVDCRDEAVLAVRSDVIRMLSNLVMNACKFTPEGGRIELRAVEAGDAVRILVSDTGPGMSPEELMHAFDRFYRAPSAERESTPGTGLGLAIVSELAQRNGGMAALATNERGGITAELHLPAAGPSGA